MLPRNFSWIEQAVIAGSGRPDTEIELRSVWGEGVRAILSLTSSPLNKDTVRQVGFDYLHEPIQNAPTLEQLHKIMTFITTQKSQSKPILVHCAEGVGRTGTVLAAYLVHSGSLADDAVRRIREKRPGSIQTPEQERVIHEFEKVVDKNHRHKK